mgnify:CR=1 FL=1
MEDLRNRVWDYLFRCREPKQVAIIAAEMNETPADIEQVVNDPWFDVRDGLVAIALGKCLLPDSRLGDTGSDAKR